MSIPDFSFDASEDERQKFCDLSGGFVFEHQMLNHLDFNQFLAVLRLTSSRLDLQNACREQSVHLRMLEMP